MRRIFLFFLVLFTAICFSVFVLFHSLDITVLNEEYVIAKLSEYSLYDKLIDSMNEPEQGIGAKAFVEIVGRDSTKTLVNSVISSVLSYLKNPSIQKIEIGLPENIFPSETTISLEDIINREQFGFLRQAKILIQTMLVARTAGLLLSIASIIIIIIIAKGIGSKMRWIGSSFIFSGALVIILSLFFQSFFISTLDSLHFNQIAVFFIKSLFWDYISLVQFYGLLLSFIGVFTIWLSILFFSAYFKGAREKILKERTEFMKKRAELESKKNI